jgi:hypothetical protein
MRLSPKYAVLCSALLASLTRVANAGECCCAHCGGCCECEKTCRLVCEDKKVDVICWGVVCEDFCLPGHGKPGCKQCKTVCVDCSEPQDPKAPCVAPKSFVWRDWRPSCAYLFTKKKLMKKTETVKVPTYKWVVEDLCPKCQGSCDVAAVDAKTEAELPPPPLAEAKLLFLRK